MNQSSLEKKIFPLFNKQNWDQLQKKAQETNLANSIKP